MCKALFLDFDGPLHPTTAIQGLNGKVSEKDIQDRGLFRWIPILEEIVRSAPKKTQDDLHIVGHTSWRQSNVATQDLIRKSLRSLSPYYVGMTNPELPRWESIVEMCERAKLDDIIIIDDNYSEFPTGLPQLMVCNPLLGISDARISEKISHWLESTNQQETPRCSGQK